MRIVFLRLQHTASALIRQRKLVDKSIALSIYLKLVCVKFVFPVQYFSSCVSVAVVKSAIMFARWLFPCHIAAIYANKLTKLYTKIYEVKK